jgi:two-component system, NarL family, nitrate/nitrite response regulator NarL
MGAIRVENAQKIAIVDSNSVTCEGLKHILNRRRFCIAQIWPDVEGALSVERSSALPAAILINVAGRTLPNDQILGQLREIFPGVRLVLFAETCDLERIREAVRAEFDGFLLETIAPEAFSKALELILIGERIFPVPQVAQMIDTARKTEASGGTAFESLSQSQMRVVAHLANACPNKIIARELGISESTVKVHVKAILRKTGARNRTDVALLARRIGIGTDLKLCASEQRPDAVLRLNK